MDQEWINWLESWDKQQTGYLKNREERFEVMLDVIEAQIGEEFVAIDFTCGPGSLTQRIIDRFPNSKVHAVDIDPVLLTLGKNAIGNRDGRIIWNEADLRDIDWIDEISVDKVDVIVSTTALHWLPGGVLVRVYRQLADIIKQNGIFITKFVRTKSLQGMIYTIPGRTSDRPTTPFKRC